ncbi:MAG: radical SAM family heme chaperone HemW [Calditrichia bacterium]
MQTAGLYIHVPFCERKCGYCDFYSVTRLQQRSAFVKALLHEIEMAAPEFERFTFDTIFLGGGTPSLLSIESLQSIWAHLHTHFKIAPEGEFTLEANPGTLKSGELRQIREAGFNRLSLGAQSFNEPDLHFLQRIHDVPAIYDGYWQARDAGFANINLDLMTAFPGLSMEAFLNTLKCAVELQPEHISCYTLIFEPDTPFYRRLQKGELRPLDNDSEADFYQKAFQFLESNGYTAYEISNYSREADLDCRHSLKYWDHQPYLGLGPAAHSFISPRRWQNVRSLPHYLNRIEKGKMAVKNYEQLDSMTLEFEYIFLHLRLRQGLKFSLFQERFDKSFLEEYNDTVRSLQQNGLIALSSDAVFLTEKGWLLADEVAASF